MDETNNVLEDIINATGLPEDLVSTSLKAYILESGKSPQNMSMDEVRDILVNLLQDVFLDIKDGAHPDIGYTD